MGITRKVKAVKGIFRELDKEIDKFKASTGLACTKGCGGACCKKPDIEASILEFLPMALYLYKNGRVEATLDQIDNTNSTGICVFFNPFINNGHTGFCSEYENRGLICRLFGFSATRDKNGLYEIAACKLIKESMPEIFQKAREDVRNGLRIPVIFKYYSKLEAIDMGLAGKMYPINTAIRLAIETVALYFYYKAPKAG